MDCWSISFHFIHGFASELNLQIEYSNLLDIEIPLMEPWLTYLHINEISLLLKLILKFKKHNPQIWNFKAYSDFANVPPRVNAFLSEAEVPVDISM